MLLGNSLPVPFLNNPNDSQSPPSGLPLILKINTGTNTGLPPMELTTDPVYTYDYTVDWGDGNVSSYTGSAIHTYSSVGDFEIKVSGTCPYFYLDWPSRNYLLDIIQWGDLEFKSLKQTFKQCRYLGNPLGDTQTPGVSLTATDTPTFASDFESDGFYEWCDENYFTSIPSINQWLIPQTVTSLQRCFYRLRWWNDSVSDWDVSNIGNFKEMFEFCRSWTNGGDDLTSWKPGKNHSGDLTFENMFYYCESIEDIAMWEQDAYLTGINFINTKQMFFYCAKWKLELINWDNTSVKMNNVESMFAVTGDYYNGSNTIPFTDEGVKTDFFGWDFNTNKTSLKSMFSGTVFDATFNANLDGHTATNITVFDDLFGSAFICSPTSVDNWVLSTTPGISMVNTFSGRTYRANERRGIDWKGTYGSVQTLNGWDVSGVVNFDFCFNSAQFNSGPDDCKPIIGSWTICTDPNVDVSLSRMFRDSQFNDTLVNDPTKWNLSSVTNLHEIFGGAGGTRFNQSLSNWDTSNVEIISQFVYYNVYFNQDISHFNLDKVTTVNRFFDKTQNYSYGMDWMELPLITDGERFQYQWKFDTQKYTDTLNAWALYYYNRQQAGLPVPQNILMTFNTISYWGVTNYFTAGLNTLGNGLTTRDYLVTATNASTPGLGWNLQDGGGI